MATKIYNDGTQILCINTVDNSKAACLNIYTFTYKEYALNTYLLSDATGTGIKVKLEEVCDEEGNTFANFDLLKEYFSTLSKQIPNLGTNVKIGNIELSNTGDDLQVLNVNTGEQSFMVRRQVDPATNVTSVYYNEQSTVLQHETVANAYQSDFSSTGKGVLNNQGRYALPIDIGVINKTFIHEYRSKLNTDIENLNIKIFNVTQSPNNLDDYRVLSGTGINSGWYISIRPYWVLNKDASTDTKAGQLITSDNATLDFENGFNLNSGNYYRFVISGDNEFEFQGKANEINPFGGTQFVPYIERSFTGQLRKEIVKQDDLNASVNEYNIIVDPSYTGAVQSGTAFEPYSDLATAISNSSTNDSVLVKGINIIASEIILPHALKFYGIAGETEIKYATYNTSNGDIFSFEGTMTETFIFKDIVFKNAGGYGLLIKKTDTLELRNCKFFNNGWDGTQLHTVVPSATFGLLGYDSTQAELQAFYAGSHASNGGAVRIQECTKPLIRECRAENNLRGFRVQDCGINGGGFIIENQSISNIESGIYIAAGSLGGCHNITVTINYSAYNANNGLLCIGGINNKFSQNEVRGNWNAGLCAWGSANTTLRDCGLYDNNRSTYNGIGNVGDAKASVQINEVYNLLGTQISLNPGFRFIAQILSNQIHYTGVGSSSEKNGVLITSAVGNLPDNPKNIITIDNTDFIGQDYALNLGEVDITNLRIDRGDNSYKSIGILAVKPPLAGNYSELPFSNHVMQVPEVDVVVDTLKQTISLHEGVGGNVINVYAINELSSVLKANSIDIIQKSSDKIQLRDCTLGNTYINGVVAGSNVNTMNDSLNAAFNMSLVQYKTFLESEVGLTIGDTATFYYIESPDNNFEYPLFKTQAEAEAFSAANGGSGYNTETYADDLTNTTWYVPTVLFVNNATEAPVNGVYGTSTSIIWNIQPTDTDSNYAPTFTDITYTIQEQSAVNIVYKPAGDTDTYNVTNIPTGYADTGYAIVGTAETITDGVDIVHTLNVTKANDFGSDTGTIALTVTDDPTNNVILNSTSWTKAIDFSGSNEHLKQVSSNVNYNPLRMNNLSVQVPVNADSGKTTNSTNARPWATTVVFKADRHNSNQHIWNSGEGAATNDDNIYLRVDAAGDLYFGWGREGVGYNECRIAQNISSSTWYGVYIASKGYRASAAAATASNLALGFDIRLMSSADSFSSVGSNLSVSSNWTSAGARMDRAVTGDFTIGGRGSNRNFHGKVASMIITTLRVNQNVPTDAEIKLMITDPLKWEDDYRDGQLVRGYNTYIDYTYNPNDWQGGGYLTNFIWLMGDGTGDTYFNGIRDQVIWTDQNVGKLQFNNMQANDEVNISINGLS